MASSFSLSSSIASTTATSSSSSSSSRPQQTTTTILSLVKATKMHASFEKLYGSKLQRRGMKRPIDVEDAEEEEDRKHFTAKIFGLDCEMVLTTKSMEIGRITLVEYLTEARAFRVVLDEHVKPSETVIDYLSHVSGLNVDLLNNARLDGIETCRRLLNELISPDDVLVGHSLWSDFEALEWWTHSRFIDTSLLFTVKDAPRLTLGLKDLVEVVMGNDVAGGMQVEGESHDSSQDAEFALRVALAFLNDDDVASRLQLYAPPVTLSDVPERYKRRITVHGFDASLVGEEHLRKIAETEFNAKMNEEEEEEDLGVVAGVDTTMTTTPPPINKPSKVIIKPVREKLTGETGISTGSTVFEYPTPASALTTFRLLPVASPLFHPHGHPDKEGFLRKSIAIHVFSNMSDTTTSSTATTHSKAEAICYHRLPLPFTKTLKIQNRLMGKVMGPKGSTVVNIQRMSGCRVSSGERGQNETEIFLAADDEEKLSRCERLIAEALSSSSSGPASGNNNTTVSKS